MPAVTQTVAGAAQFTGLVGAGLFSFAKFDLLPITSRVSLLRCAYHSATGGNGGTRIDFYFKDPTGVATAIVLLGRGLAPTIPGPSGDADFTICGGAVPRNKDGTHWDLFCISAGKTVDATWTVDYEPGPHPHTSERDPIP